MAAQAFTIETNIENAMQVVKRILVTADGDDDGTVIMDINNATDEIAMMANVGIGVANTSQKLQVDGNIATDANVHAAEYCTANGTSCYTIAELLAASGAVVSGGSGDNLGSHIASIDLNMSNRKITDLGTPTATTDAATKAYVDTAVAGGG